MDDLIHYIKITNELIEKKINCELKSLNVTASQMRILLELYRSEGESVMLKDLEKIFNVTQATTQGTVARMEKKGYLVTYYLPTDKRSKGVRLTDGGRALAETAFDRIESVQNKIADTLSAEKTKEFVYLIDKIYNAIQ